MGKAVDVARSLAQINSGCTGAGLRAVCARVPAERAPDDLVDVVVAAFGIGDEADRLVGKRVEDRRLVARAGVDDLAAFGQRVGHVPVGNRVLAAQAVGDVRVVTDRVAGGDCLSQFGQAHSRLRAIDDAAQPRRLGAQDREELVEPGLREALGRDPHLGVGMKSPEVGRLLFQECHEWSGAGVPRVAPGHEDRVDPRQFLEYLGPFCQSVFDRSGIAVVGIHRRVPDPDVEPVVGGDLGHPGHHLERRQWKVWAVGRIVGAWRDQLDRVACRRSARSRIYRSH